jgi:hypothetical protein
MRVTCFAVDGGLVVAGEIPPCGPGGEPDVLLWGARFFRLQRAADGTAVRDVAGAVGYVEAFAVALVDYTDVRI